MFHLSQAESMFHLSQAESMFHLSQAEIDLVSGSATVAGTEPAPPGPPPPRSPRAAALPKTVQVRFCFYSARNRIAGAEPAGKAGETTSPAGSK